MWDLTGAYIRQMGVEEHDALLAASSHMPHIVAYALTRALERDVSDPMVHGGGALRDMTRIAGSDPLMWTDISVTNQTPAERDRRISGRDELASRFNYIGQCGCASRLLCDLSCPSACT